MLKAQKSNRKTLTYRLMDKIICAVFATVLLCPSVSALDIEAPLPTLTIKNSGEIILDKGKAKFVSWSSGQLDNTINLVQVLAASQQAADLNRPYLDKFGKQFESNKSVNTTTVVVSNNIPSLLGGFVKRELKKNKKAHPHAIMINDKKGLTRDVWQLPNTEAILILIDSNGVVKKYHEGELAESEHQSWLMATEKLLPEDSLLLPEDSHLLPEDSH